MLTTRAHSQVEKQMANTVRRCTFSVMYSVYLNSPSSHFGLPGIQNQGGVQTTTQILFDSGLSTKYVSRPHAVLASRREEKTTLIPVVFAELRLRNILHATSTLCLISVSVSSPVAKWRLISSAGELVAVDFQQETPTIPAQVSAAQLTGAHTHTHELWSCCQLLYCSQSDMNELLHAGGEKKKKSLFVCVVFFKVSFSSDLIRGWWERWGEAGLAAAADRHKIKTNSTLKIEKTAGSRRAEKTRDRWTRAEWRRV